MTFLTALAEGTVLDSCRNGYLPSDSRELTREVDRSRGVSAPVATELIEVDSDTHRKGSQLDRRVLQCHERVGAVDFASQENVYRAAGVSGLHRHRRPVHEPRALRRSNPALRDRELIFEPVQQMEMPRPRGGSKRLPHENVALQGKRSTPQ
jgi:hypothetical protein